MKLRPQLREALTALDLDFDAPPTSAAKWRQLLIELDAELPSRDEAARQRAILGSIGDGVITSDERGIIRFLNDAAVHLLRDPGRRLIGTSLGAIVVDDDLQRDGEPQLLGLSDALAMGLHYRNDAGTLRALGGEAIPVSFVVTPVRGGGDSAGGAVLVVRDIVEWRRTQDALHRARLDAERASMAKSRLLEAFGRSLAPRMNDVVGLSRALHDAVEGSGDQRAMLSQIRSSGERLLVWLDDVLDLCGSESSQLPRISAAAAPVGRSPELPEAGEDGQAPTVLVADDNQINRVIVSRHVEALGYRVALAVDGQGAVEAVQEGDVAVVLMDANMPGMSGYEATREVRLLEASFGRHIPVIGMLSVPGESASRRCREAGMDGHVVVPIARAELGDVLEVHLARADQDVGGAPPLDPATLDTLRGLSDDDDEDFLAGIVEEYLADQGTRLRLVREAVGRGDLETSVEEVSMLRGRSANIGARPLAELCQVMEAFVLGGDVGQARDMITALEREAGRVARALEPMRSTPGVRLARAG